ncbi:MAG: hypothetical protein HYT16_03640, partial [DPANN group archaeon]|nr:hypothetical protein [DPANN group archaeon]
FAINSERLQNQTRTTLSVGNLTTSNLTLQGNLTHYLGGVLINSTGGINASAVGFGTIPQGVLDTPRNWTADQQFINLNISGHVNITASGTNTLGRYFFTLFGSGAGGEILRVDDVSAPSVHILGGLNITNNYGGDNAFRVVSTVGTYSPIILANTNLRYLILGTLVTSRGTLNVTNITHSGGLLVNTTGGINASAVGFGLIPNGVLDQPLNWSGVQRFTSTQTSDLNVSGMVNISEGAIVNNFFNIFAAGGVSLLSVSGGASDSINIATRFFNMSPSTGVDSAFAIRSIPSGGVRRLMFGLDNRGPGKINIAAVLNISNNLTFGGAGGGVGGVGTILLINDTGGINASAVGFGTLPSGIFGATSIPDAALSANVALLASIQTFSNRMTINGGATGGPDLSLIAPTGGITHALSVLTSGSVSVFNITAAGELQIQNITHFSNRAIIINNTGFVNASTVGAVGDAKLPTGVLPLYVNSSATPMTQGAMINIGNAITTSSSDSQAASEVVVNLSIGYTCRLCYTVTVTDNNASGALSAANPIVVKHLNASSFNITALLKGGFNISWMAIGY